jgi:hypothetical protein
MKRLAQLWLLSATVAGASLLASTARATTVPGVLYTVTATITDRSITLSHKSKGTLGLHRLPRGSSIRYRVINNGARPYVFEIWGARSAPIRPHKTDTMLVNWTYRGRYLYRILYHGRAVGPSGYITVF